ncbi:MAG: sulfatase/phosphatase domain-containing protein, partial [Bryobacteraceae bacterium]
LYEHSVRVPLVIRGPGVGRGQRAGGFVYLLDVFPTLCELAGLAVPPEVEGRSLVPMIRNPRVRPRDSVFYAYRDVQRGVSDGRWKLIVYRVAGRETVQLFDLGQDPWEQHNLAESNAGRVRRMRELLKDWQSRTDDPGWTAS